MSWRRFPNSFVCCWCEENQNDSITSERVRSESIIKLKLFIKGDKGHSNCKDERPHASSDKEPSTWSPKSIRFLGVCVFVHLWPRMHASDMYELWMQWQQKTKINCSIEVISRQLQFIAASQECVTHCFLGFANLPMLEFDFMFFFYYEINCQHCQNSFVGSSTNV